MIQVWDSNVGKPVEVFRLNESPVFQHTLNTQFSLVAAAKAGDHVQLLDLRTGSQSHVLRSGHTGYVSTVAWSRANSSILASGGSDGKVVLWDVRKARSYIQYLDFNKVKARMKYKSSDLSGYSHKGQVQGLIWTPLDRCLISIGQDRIRKWDPILGTNRKTNFAPVEIQPIQLVNLQVSSGENEYLFVPEKSNVAMLDISSGRCVKYLTGHYRNVKCLVYNPQHVELYTGGKDKKIHIWSPETENLHVENNEQLQNLQSDTWSDSDEEF